MKKQEFKTIDLVVSIVMLVSLGGVTIGIIKHNRSQGSPNQVLRMAENISSQLLNLDRKKFHSSNYNLGDRERNPSSKDSKIQSVRLGPEGVIGLDPWGKPFQYRFIENPSGKWTHLIVWSAGPDSIPVKQISDWSHKLIVQKGYNQPKSEIQLGDDFGLIIAMQD